MRWEETRRIKVLRQDGKAFIAVQYTKMISVKETSGRTEWAKGTIGWKLSNGSSLNTDDDEEFEDLDGNTYMAAI